MGGREPQRIARCLTGFGRGVLGGGVRELPVSDIDAALAYYRDVLGFSVEGRDADDSGCLLLGSVPCASVRLYLSRRGGAPQAARCWIRVSAVDLLARLVRARGARILEEVHDEPWGYRQFTLEDPDGHRLIFFRFVDEGEASLNHRQPEEIP